MDLIIGVDSSKIRTLPGGKYTTSPSTGLLSPPHVSSRDHKRP